MFFLPRTFFFPSAGFSHPQHRRHLDPRLPTGQLGVARGWFNQLGWVSAGLDPEAGSWVGLGIISAQQRADIQAAVGCAAGLAAALLL